MPQIPAPGVAALRNSRAIAHDLRLDGRILTHNLLRPEPLSAHPAESDT